MDIKDVMKFQMITGKDNKNLKVMIALFVAEEVTKFANALFNHFKKKCKNKIEETISSQVSDKDIKGITLSQRHNVNIVNMKRVWKDPGESFRETNSMVDSVLLVLSRLDNIPSLLLINDAKTLANFTESPVQITKEIYAKIGNIAIGETGMVDSVRLTLSSTILSSADIYRWMRSVHDSYKEDMKNAFGDSIFFFDQKVSGNPENRGGTDESGDIAKSMRLLSAPKHLTFTKTLFYSNKNFNNIFGKEARLVEQRVKFFMENKEWYDSRGIPYQLGIMLSGVPGSGKTSIIRAISNYTKRHIVNVNFANITTATQLKNLFFSENITVLINEVSVNVNIPINQRIYVLEEIDAVGDVVKQRTGEVVKAMADELTLGEILTTLDGTLESPGRIVVMTSNHPEILDKALIRPGRIDIAVKFGMADRELIVDMYEAFFEQKFPKNLTTRIPNEVLTPAEVGQVFFRHFTDFNAEKIISDLNESIPVKPSRKEALFEEAVAEEPKEEPKEPKEPVSGSNSIGVTACDKHKRHDKDCPQCVAELTKLLNPGYMFEGMGNDDGDFAPF